MFPLRKSGKSRNLFWKILLTLILLLGSYLFYPEVKDTGKTILQDNYEKAFVSRVIDGDTIVLQDGRKVRLICINTPEKGQFYYTQATDYMKQEVLNKEILLEKDVSETDKYGRLLRYVRDAQDNHLINYDSVFNGYAELDRISPNVRYCNLFKEAQAHAQEQHLGIWT